MPMMDGTGPFGKGRPGCGRGPCRINRDDAARPSNQMNQGMGSGLGPRFRNVRKPGLSGMRNRFGGHNRGGRGAV